MKLALILFSILTSLSLCFATQGTPVTCRGKSLPIALLPGPKMTGLSLPLRFGGTREFPRPPINRFHTEKGFREVIKTREQFNDFWKRFTTPISPNNQTPLPPEIDFSKEMIVISAMGMRPTSGYWTIIDGACEVNGQIEVFVTNVENTTCGGFTSLTYPADAVRLPQSDLPVIFRETQISCIEFSSLLQRLSRAGGR
ncbi:MAG TPA: hypothetical protein VN844_20320 [Pyrinomonadaceae bacterium]|nr:hypothetical protein [Pyrinomonadaceae bacterium]